jgi:transcriptional regulator with XRE-family HTH domain
MVQASKVSGPGQLSATVRRYRTRAGLTQRQLADLSTVSIRAIRDLEAGRTKHPRSDTIRLLAASLRIPPPQQAALEVAASQSDPPADPVTVAEDAGLPPAATNALLGREAEVDLLCELACTANERAMSIVGLGGVGKTRLALELAHRLSSRHGYGVLWFPSGSASSLVTDQAGLARLGEVIGGRETLLVLDGCDLVAPPAPLVEMLHRCPHLRVLVTRRDPRGAPGRLIPVAPLPVPDDGDDPGTLVRLDSVRLLLQDIKVMRPSMRLDGQTAPTISAICRLLDGLPGALRTVGHWSLLFTPEQLLGQLVRGDRPPAAARPFHQSIVEVGDGARFALDRIDPSARGLLKGLLAAPVPWTVPVAADLAGGDLSAAANAVHLMMLYGLIRRDETPSTPEFRILNTVRMRLAPDRGAMQPEPAPGSAGI